MAQERARREAQAAAIALEEQRRAEEERQRKEQERLEAERKAAEAARKAEEERIAAAKAAAEAAEARRILEEDFKLQTALADDKKATVVQALKKRREGILEGKKQCDQMAAGQA